MNKTPSPYCVQTISGTLELTKGTYLTMLKRKQSTIKTLIKSKPISRLTNSKQTVKKNLKKSMGWVSSSLRRSTRSQILMKDRQDKTHVFKVCGDEQLFASRVVIPSIEMVYDNDLQSQWPDIEHNIQEMSMSLSIEAFDRRFRNL